MIYRRSRAIIAAIALTLVLAMPAAAVTSTVSESLTVDSAITMTGVPASINYGNAIAGGPRVTATPFDITVSSNDATGWYVSAASSVLTSSEGTIPVTARRHVVGTVSGCTNPASVTLGPSFTGTGSAPDTTGGKVFMTSSGAGTGCAKFTAGINVPGSALAGSYTGTLTFEAVIGVVGG